MREQDKKVIIFFIQLMFPDSHVKKFVVKSDELFCQ